MTDMNMETFGYAEQGLRSDMQDVYFIRDEGRVMAVFDGHGDHGAVAAENAADFFDDTWDRYNARNRAEQFIACDKEIGAINGGTTATIAEIVTYGDDEHVVYVHNVGDSPAYVIDDVHREREPIEVFQHHDVYNPSEVARMAREGSFVGTKPYEKYFAVSGVAFLAVSRALGDYAARGVIPRPSKTVERLDEGQLIIVASDGALSANTRGPVLEKLQSGKSLEEMTRDAIDAALPVTSDNATLLVTRVLK